MLIIRNTRDTFWTRVGIAVVWTLFFTAAFAQFSGGLGWRILGCAFFFSVYLEARFVEHRQRDRLTERQVTFLPRLQVYNFK